MDPILLPSIVRDGFTISVEQEGTPCLKLSGNAEMGALPLLSTYLQQLHEGLCRRATSSVDVDLRDLYFMNSSCFKCLVDWIASINRLELSRKYCVRFITNPGLAWQARNLEAMRSFAPEVVTSARPSGYARLTRR